MAKSKKESTARPLPLTHGKLQRPHDDALEASCPNLAQCLFSIWEEDKCLRQAGSLRIRLVGGYYLVTLSCPTEGMETTLTLAQLGNVLADMEAWIASPSCVWTPDFAAQKKARQVKV